MKKYISLLLAAIMLLSSFAILTSCGGGGEETPAPETPVDRYTVTEEEWLANMESFNYTVICKNINTDCFTDEDRTTYSYSTLYLQMSEDGVYCVNEQLMYGNYESRKFLQVYTDQGDFNVYQNLYTGGYEAVEIYENEWKILSELFGMYGFNVNNDTAYYSFVYDESSKCYSFTYTYNNSYNDILETQVTNIKVTFLNGVIQTMTLQKTRNSDGFSSTYIYDLTFSNVGNTKIDIPSYTVVEQ